MFNSEIVIILLLLFVIEYFFQLNNNKKMFIYFCRYILLNSLLYIAIAFCYMREYFWILLFVFIIKLILDKILVFKTLDFKVTNWKEYYEKKPLKIIDKKRKNNIKYIVNVLRTNKFNGGVILEYGGGNSFVAEAISNNFNINKFVIVDSNEYGIKLLDKRNISNLEKHCDSIFDYADKENYDLVYSIGLIEHFQGDYLIKCIDKHFEMCKKGGWVLLTFPVNCFRYRVIRMVLEIFNMWQYTDEVPLKKDYIEKIISENGSVMHSSINKKLILPQAIILIKR